MSEEAFRQNVTAINKTQAELDQKIEKWVNRVAVNNEISMVEAKKLLSKNELKEFHWTLDEYINYGKQNEINKKLGMVK